jgi:uncharacterized protein involved in outer membrane biogenesis
MSNEITFQDLTGEPVSGRFEVSDGLIRVTLSDGTKTTADIEESMLSPEILARVLLLQCIGPNSQTQTTKTSLRIRKARSAQRQAALAAFDCVFGFCE